VRGRRPKPPELKVLTGNPGRRPLPRRDVQPTAGARCPKFLSPAARGEWKRLYPELERLGLVTMLDRAVLACYCEAWSQFTWATGELKRTGHTTVAGNGTTIPHPAVGIRKAAMRMLRELSIEFGFTPSSRGRVEFVGPQGPDDEDRFFLCGPRPLPGPKGA
jgi:P27 family predicted phage terminase small subunit